MYAEKRAPEDDDGVGVGVSVLVGVTLGETPGVGVIVGVMDGVGVGVFVGVSVGVLLGTTPKQIVTPSIISFLETFVKTGTSEVEPV
jgi:hypothetical protein